MAPPNPDREPIPEGLPVLDPKRFAPSRRRQLSGPGLRAFLRIAEEWQLSEQERLHILGFPARSTFHSWIGKARRGRDITLSVDELIRISAVLGIYKALKIVFLRDDEAIRWLRSRNSGLIFGERSPLSLITSGTQDALMLVRRHLDAWRGGTFAAPAPGFDEAIAPLSDGDVVIV